jgi:hypothetical protein
MSKVKVPRYCSIPNYLKEADPKLHELINELCIGKIFHTSDRNREITFLRPDAKLSKQLIDMAAKDPEKVVTHLNSMVLLGDFEEAADFGGAEVVNLNRVKLPVKSVAGSKVDFGGFTATPDKDFKRRNDRRGINVFVLSGALPPLDGQKVDLSAKPAARPVKKGGAEISGLNRTTLFQRILDAYCKNDNDPAMELLLALCDWAKNSNPKPRFNAGENGSIDICNLIELKCSHDTIASLAIILQPYKQQNPKYISDEQLNSFIAHYQRGDQNLLKHMNLYYGTPGAFARYREIVEKKRDSCTKFAEARDKLIQDTIPNINRANAASETQMLLSVVNGDANGHLNIPSLPLPLLLAEAELRVLSILALETGIEMEQLAWIFSNCRLDNPLFCDNREMQMSGTVAFYYSTVYLVVRSMELYYVSGCGIPDAPGNNYPVEDRLICLNGVAANSPHLLRKKEQSDAMIEVLKSAAAPVPAAAAAAAPAAAESSPVSDVPEQ